MIRQSMLVSGTCAVSVMLAGAASADSLSPPYVVAVPGAGVQSIVPILTVGEGLGNYRFVGIPDGLGAHGLHTRNTFRLFCNHELGQTAGVVRAHGGTGAFVSQWDFSFAPNGGSLTFTPLAAQDAIQTVQEYNDATGQYVPVTNGRFARLCGAYLAGRWSGFTNYAFMTGEETSDANTLDGVDGGQSFAVINGTAYAVPRLGRSAKENQVVLRGTGVKTVVIPLEDTTPAQVYVYVGTKQKIGPNILAPNGLHNGNLYTLVASGGVDHEDDLVKGAPVGFSLAQVDWTLPDNALETQAQSLNAMDFVRIEDGAYDLNNPNVFYFVSTGGNVQNPNGKLHKIVFNDVKNPTLGGTIEVLLDGSEGMISPDNIEINSAGQLLMQEDPTFTLVGRDSSIWAYDVNTASLTRILQIDTPVASGIEGATYSLGKWETSGIIDASHILGAGWWIFDVQAHYNLPDVELVQGGQLIAMKWLPVAP